MSHGPAPWTALEKYAKARESTVLRSDRMAAAKAMGTHLPVEWHVLMNMFGCCVRCGAAGFPLTKDHIISVADGGCDCIANLQPLCRACNSAAAVGVDYRDAAIPDWSKRLTNIMGRIFQWRG